MLGRLGGNSQGTGGKTRMRDPFRCERCKQVIQVGEAFTKRRGKCWHQGQCPRFLGRVETK